MTGHRDMGQTTGKSHSLNVTIAYITSTKAHNRLVPTQLPRFIISHRICFPCW